MDIIGSEYITSRVYRHGYTIVRAVKCLLKKGDKDRYLIFKPEEDGSESFVIEFNDPIKSYIWCKEHQLEERE